MLKKVHGYENGIELQFSSRLIGEETSQAKTTLFSNGITNIPLLMVPLSIRLSVLQRGTTVFTRKV